LDPVTGIIVGVSGWESYASNCCIDNSFTVDNLNSINALISDIRQSLRSLGPPELLRDADDAAAAELILGRCHVNLHKIEKFNLQIKNLVCSDDVFFESLIMNIRNDVISYQSYKSKVLKKDELDLISELKVLKSNYDQNFDRIVNIEKALNSLNDKKLKVQVEKFRSFEHLNKEKVTPFTLKLLKQTNKEFKLSKIKILDGSDFSSGSDHSEYIRQHFANIYEPVFEESNVFTGCIEEFLGPEVLNHPVVKNSRLNSSEKNKLDEPLSIAELDKALLEANKKSAPLTVSQSHVSDL
jgi:hypothetical protein